MSFENSFKSISVSGELSAVRWGIPGNWTSVTEAKFTEFSSSATFDVVGSVGGPQTGSTTGFSNQLHRVSQVLWCTSSVDLMYQRTQVVFDSVFELHPGPSAADYWVLSFFAARCLHASSAALTVMLCVCVCVSVCHVRTFCQNVRLFLPSGRLIILVFPHKTGRQ